MNYFDLVQHILLSLEDNTIQNLNTYFSETERKLQLASRRPYSHPSTVLLVEILGLVIILSVLTTMLAKVIRIDTYHKTSLRGTRHTFTFVVERK